MPKPIIKTVRIVREINVSFTAEEIKVFTLLSNGVPGREIVRRYNKPPRYVHSMVERKRSDLLALNITHLIAILLREKIIE